MNRTDKYESDADDLARTTVIDTSNIVQQSLIESGVTDINNSVLSSMEKLYDNDRRNTSANLDSIFYRATIVLSITSRDTICKLLTVISLNELFEMVKEELQQLQIKLPPPSHKLRHHFEMFALRFNDATVNDMNIRFARDNNDMRSESSLENDIRLFNDATVNETNIRSARDNNDMTSKSSLESSVNEIGQDKQMRFDAGRKLSIIESQIEMARRFKDTLRLQILLKDMKDEFPEYYAKYTATKSWGKCIVTGDDNEKEEMRDDDELGVVADASDVQYNAAETNPFHENQWSSLICDYEQFVNSSK